MRRRPLRGAAGYTFSGFRLSGFQPVVKESLQLGTLYVQSDLGEMAERLWRYAAIAFAAAGLSLLAAYALSRRLQQRMSRPIMALADTARVVSDQHDYSVRAAATGTREFDMLAGAFNHMLTQIQESEGAMRSQLGRLGLLQHITRPSASARTSRASSRSCWTASTPISVRTSPAHSLRPRSRHIDGVPAGRREPGAAAAARSRRRQGRGHRCQRSVPLHHRRTRVRTGSRRGIAPVSAAVRGGRPALAGHLAVAGGRTKSPAYCCAPVATRMPSAAPSANSCASSPSTWHSRTIRLACTAPCSARTTTCASRS